MKLITNTLIAGILCASAPAFATDVPGMDLISESVTFDGVNINNFQFENGQNIITVKPCQLFNAHMCYRVDASRLKTLRYHHVIVGLYDDGPQHCILHTLGVKDSCGPIDVRLRAPQKPGVYQVRFSHSTGLSNKDAMNSWDHGEAPSVDTVTGIVIVKE